MPPIVVLDACILFSAPLRDTLLWAAEANLYCVKLTDEILEEARRNLVTKRRLPEARSWNFVRAIQKFFKNHFVTDYEHHLSSMPINEKDRHVLAAAVECDAQIIVTNNLKDFPQQLLDSYDIVALSPDTFLLQLLAANQEEVKNLLIRQTENLNNPRLTVSEVLDRLSLEAPRFVRMARELF
jgi:predicted nucleic acid-binding protein